MAKQIHPLPNNYWVRHFLVCNALAKGACENRGWQCENFAKTILQERTETKRAKTQNLNTSHRFFSYAQRARGWYRIDGKIIHHEQNRNLQRGTA
jgi:hypothetical protein